MTEDLLKVIAGLECCRDTEITLRCEVCPYDYGRNTSGSCVGALMTDALRILREVEQDGLY